MSAPCIEVVTGDPVACVVQLKKITDAGEITFNIPLATEVKAALVTRDRATKLTESALLNSASPEADWSTSLVYVEIPKTETAGIAVFGPAILEIQVADGVELTWWIPVKIVKGNID